MTQEEHTEQSASAAEPCLVTLYSEQTATVRVLAPVNSSNAELTELALLELDASGGVEWEAQAGWIDSVEWCSG